MDNGDDDADDDDDGDDDDKLVVQSSFHFSFLLLDFGFPITRIDSL